MASANLDGRACTPPPRNLEGAQRHDHSPRISQDRRSGGDGSRGCARNRPRPGRAQMEDAVDVAGRIGQPEDLRRLGQEGQRKPAAAASRSSRWRSARSSPTRKRSARCAMGCSIRIIAARLMRRASSPAWRCSATSTAVSRTPIRCRCGSSTAAGSSSLATSTSASTRYYVGPVWWGVESVPARKPLRTLAEFKGVKMRVPEGLGRGDLAPRRRRRRHAAGQRSLHGARARRDRGDRLGHARDEQRPRLPQDREIPAVSGLPLDAVRRGRRQL